MFVKVLFLKYSLLLISECILIVGILVTFEILDK